MLPAGTGRLQGDPAQASIAPVEGDADTIAETLRGFAREGIGHVQLVLDPITRGAIEALGPVLEALDQGSPASVEAPNGAGTA